MENLWYVDSEEASIVFDFLKTLPIGGRCESFKWWSCETLHSCFSDVSLTVASAFVSSLLFLASLPAQQNQHIKQTEGGVAFRPQTEERVTDNGNTRKRAGRGRERGRGRGTPFQSKQEPRSVLKSNLILQFKDPTKLFSRKRREARKPWR